MTDFTRLLGKPGDMGLRRRTPFAAIALLMTMALAAPKAHAAFGYEPASTPSISLSGELAHGVAIVTPGGGFASKLLIGHR